MGAVLSIARRAREFTWDLNSFYDYGRPFVDMLKDHRQYGEWLDAETEYEIKLAKSTLHWYLLVKKKGSQILPYVSLEITVRDLIPAIRNFEVCNDRVTDEGVFKGSLFKICCFADEIVSRMGEYNLFTKNYQHFCNELLLKLSKEELPITFNRGSITEERLDVDHLYRVIPEAEKEEVFSSVLTAKCPAVRCSAQSVRSQTPRLRAPSSKPCTIYGSKVVILTDGSSVGISSKPSLDDLQSLLEILGPLEVYWKELGHKLALLPYTLNRPENRGMHNMLKKYMEEPSRSWDNLANAVAKFDKVVAQRVVELGKTRI